MLINNHVDTNLIAFTSKVGADINFVQGAGGNISTKQGGVLCIKGSGTWMRDASNKNIFVSIPLEEVLAKLNSAEINFASDQATGLKPSIETPLHALLPQKYVLHVHMINAIIYSAMQNAKALLQERLESLPWAMVPYCRPGLPLCKALADEMAKYELPPDVIVLQNHGLIVAAETISQLQELLIKCATKLFLPMRSLTCSPQYEILTAVNDAGWNMPTEIKLHAIGLVPEALHFAAGAPLYPDHVVFLGPKMLILDAGKSLRGALAAYSTQYGLDAKVAIVPGAGVLVAPDAGAGVLAMLEALNLTGLTASPNVALTRLTPEDVAILLNWDAEKLRKQMDSQN